MRRSDVTTAILATSLVGLACARTPATGTFGDASTPGDDARPADAAGTLDRILGASCQYSDRGLCTGYVVPPRGALANRDGKATSESILFSAESLCVAFLGTWQRMPCATDSLKGSCEIDDEGLVEFYAADGTRTASSLLEACAARGGVWRD